MAVLRKEGIGRGRALSAVKPATIEDVALIAGVSIATVSRALNEPGKVADSTRRRVIEAVAQTGYTTNAMARNLRTRRSHMILILAPDVGDPNFSNILVGLETEASKRGYGVLIGNTQNDPVRETDYLRFIASNQADGIILFTGHLPFGLIDNQPGARLPPMVAINEPIPNSSIPFVGVDNIEGARVAVPLPNCASAAFAPHSRRPAFQRRPASYSKPMEPPKAAAQRPSACSCATGCRRPFSASTMRRRWGC